MLREFLLLTFLVHSFGFYLNGQSISPEPGNSTICPGESIRYTITPGTSFKNCDEFNWTLTNGTFVNGQSVTSKTTTVYYVDVYWNDVAGKGTLTVTGTGCDNEATFTKSEEYAIRSLKDRNLENARANNTLPYCSTSSINIQVDQMLLLNTGGTTGIIQQYADGYEWELPPGWTSGGHGAGVPFTTGAPIIDIVPIHGCSGGAVKVKAYVNCSSGKKYSKEASIPVSRPTPNLTITPQAGYNGPSCGNQNAVTFTVTPISCAATYRWVFSGSDSNTPTGWLESTPSGWAPISSPVITTTNYITVKPSGSEADAGSILATVILSCDTQIPSTTYQLDYQEPVISGLTTLCDSETFTLNNASGVSPTWSSSNTDLVTINSGGIATKVGGDNANGSVMITAQFMCGPNSVTKEKTIWVGKPQINVPGLGDPFGTPPMQFCQTYYFDTQNKVELTGSGFNSATFDWQPITTNFGYQVQGNILYVQPHTIGSIVFKVRAKNLCNVWTSYSIFQYSVIDCDNPANPQQYITTYPNPASSELTIQLSDSLYTQNRVTDQSYKMELISDQSLERIFSAQSSAKEIKIPLDKFPDGTYYLKIYYREAVVQKQIIIKK